MIAVCSIAYVCKLPPRDISTFIGIQCIIVTQPIGISRLMQFKFYAQNDYEFFNIFDKHYMYYYPLRSMFDQ